MFLKRVVHLGGCNDASMAVLDPQDSRVTHLESLVYKKRLFQPEHVCYAARANSLLVRADGRIGKCTVALSDPANTIGRLLPDGTMDVDNPRLREWLQGWESRDPEMISCPYLGFTRPQEPLFQVAKRPSGQTSRQRRPESDRESPQN